MTRINVIEPAQLVNEHLMAEYRECTRVPLRAINRILSKGVFYVAPSQKYILNKGHETYFTFRLPWLLNRYTLLHDELILRGYNLDDSIYQAMKARFRVAIRLVNAYKKSHGLTDAALNIRNYYPEPEELYVNMQRLTDNYYKNSSI